MDEGPRMFMGTVDERLRGLVGEIDGDLAGNGRGRDMRLQKSGYAVSYVPSRKGRWRRSCPGEQGWSSAFIPNIYKDTGAPSTHCPRRRKRRSRKRPPVSGSSIPMPAVRDAGWDMPS